MDLAILFWFYKEPEICENRLQLLKKFNPDLKIFGLYGGKVSEAQEYQEKLGKYLDDFYTFTANEDDDWKWINGDLMILDWYDKQGRNLDWDSVAIVQWDMLVFDSLQKQFSEMEKNEIFLSGLREIDGDLEQRWDWIKRGSKDSQNYLAFLDYVKSQYAYTDKPMASLFIFEVIPRIFFDKYSEVGNKDLGMLEYKTPIYSQIFKIPFYQKDIGVKWYEDEPKPLNAVPEEISEAYIKEELAKETGWRIFHPYFKSWNQ